MVLGELWRPQRVRLSSGTQDNQNLIRYSTLDGCMEVDGPLYFE